MSETHSFFPDIDWTSGQNIYGDWIPPRTQGYLAARKSEQRRERLKISRISADEIEVMNGTGAKILEMKLMDREWKEYASKTPLEAGAKARLKGALKKATIIGPPKFDGMDALFSLCPPKHPLEPGCYGPAPGKLSFHKSRDETRRA